MLQRFAWSTTLAVCLSILSPTATAETPEDAETETDASETTGDAGLFGQHHWRRYVAYGGLGVGAGLLAAGIGVDAATGGRVHRLDEAIEGGDAERVRQLQQKNRRARSTAVALYGTSGLFLIGAGTLFAVDLAIDRQARESAGLQIGVGFKRLRIAIEW